MAPAGMAPVPINTLLHLVIIEHHDCVTLDWDQTIYMYYSIIPLLRIIRMLQATTMLHSSCLTCIHAV